MFEIPFHTFFFIRQEINITEFDLIHVKTYK